MLGKVPPLPETRRVLAEALRGYVKPFAGPPIAEGQVEALLADEKARAELAGLDVKPGRRHPGVGVGAVVFRDGRLLMVQRAGAHGAGQWSVPGGWVEFGESIRAAAERECREETGVWVVAGDPLVWTTDVWPEGIHSVTAFVLCQWIEGEGEVVEPEKCPVVEWKRRADLPLLPLFGPTRKVWPQLWPSPL